MYQKAQQQQHRMSCHCITTVYSDSGHLERLTNKSNGDMSLAHQLAWITSSNQKKQKEKITKNFDDMTRTRTRQMAWIPFSGRQLQIRYQFTWHINIWQTCVLCQYFYGTDKCRRYVLCRETTIMVISRLCSKSSFLAIFWSWIYTSTSCQHVNS